MIIFRCLVETCPGFWGTPHVPDLYTHTQAHCTCTLQGKNTNANDMLYYFQNIFFFPIRYGYNYYFSQTRGFVRVLCSVQLRVSLWCRFPEASTLGSEGQWLGTVLTLTWEDEVCEHNFILLQLSVSLTVLCLFALLIAATRYSTALPYNTGGYIMDSAWGKVRCCCVTQQDQWFTSAL